MSNAEVKSEVHRLLNKFPQYRGNDEALTAKFWFIELKRRRKNPEKIKAVDFLFLYANHNSLTPAVRIIQMRQRIQLEFPELKPVKQKNFFNDKHY